MYTFQRHNMETVMTSSGALLFGGIGVEGGACKFTYDCFLTIKIFFLKK